MTAPPPFTEAAKQLQIRSAPRPAARINRKLLMAGAGLGALGLFAAATIALAPPRPKEPPQQEELVAAGKRRPDGFSSLPADYTALADVPVLGPPLSGDLGSTILAAEQAYGIETEFQTEYQTDFRTRPEDEAVRSARLEAAVQADEAARAPLQFRLSGAAALQAPAQPAAEASFDLSSELLALTRGSPNADTSLEPDPNLQSRKTAFASEQKSNPVYNPDRVQDPLSPYQLMAGSLIPASLITGINSDLPGTVIAQVTESVYDTVRGQHLLIPQGSRLIGRYQSEVSFGQDRTLVVWDRILMPDGSSVTISEPGTDASGYAGLEDRTDHHWDKVFAAAGLATLLGIGAELGPDEDDDIERAIRRGTTDTVNEAGQRAVDRSLGVQPSIKVRPGWPVRVIVTKDLVLRPFQETAP
ncbi:MAG: TrbI/VirB10 family protein [Acidobacteria bacterium]|nr:TrbI/VirB10 family protein [Acidobacteriota bacterium]